MFDQPHHQLEWFTAYVNSGRAPRWTMEPTDLHGFLTGLAMAGTPHVEEWMPWVWSGERPAFYSEEEEWYVLSEILALEEGIRGNAGGLRLLSPAVLPSVGNGWYYAADWAEGFLQSIEAFPQAWQQVMDTAEASLMTVLAPCYHNHEDEYSGMIDLQGVNEINYHLRQISHVLQGAYEQPIIFRAA